ncbi:MAG TPA: hypothetical protein VMR49_00615 [Candidatus Paceibacterota bacterium]|jgi:hypothetical protein|nr:hypothetical protein [Candidatus Paceibacterota bacterium]
MAKIIVPSTKTPEYIVPILLAIMIGLGILLCLFLGLGKWGLLILLACLASTTSLYTESNIPAFHAIIILNIFTGKMRTAFSGVNFKLPWEKVQHEAEEKKYIDLRVDLKEVCEETYASSDALMEVKYVYTIRPDISEDDEDEKDAGEKILLFSSFEPSAIKSKGRALFSMLLSDYYGRNPGEKLLNKALINKEIFGDDEQKPKQPILEFEKNHGVQVTVRLEDSDFDKATQKFRDMISGAKSIDQAIVALMTDTKLPDGTIIKGMERPQAEKVVKLMNLDGYKEQDFNLNVTAPDLKNVRDITVLGGLAEEKKGGKK